MPVPTVKPCIRCGVPVEGDYSLEGQTLFGFPIVVTACCESCGELEEAEAIEEEREQFKRDIPFLDPSDN